jgi:two-component system response regulator HydG
LISRALEASHGNQSEAARKLGTSRVTLIDKIKKYRLGGADGTGS